MSVWYMAHPVSGDVPANLARALRWLRWLSITRPEATYIAPWIPAVMVGDDSDPVQRAKGLADDIAVVKRCDGIVLVGGRISTGMAIEQGAALVANLPILDLTHLGDEPPAVQS